MAAYQVLARKWRPKKFADLVGQQHVVKALQNALDKGRLHHAYLLTGTRGVGKTTIARILAKSLNCEHPNHGEPCGVCESCQAIDSGRFVDLLEIDAASNTGIDNIREVLENAQYAPTAGKYKVYIIDEVHMLSKSAFNAMLKTLEEPPEHVKFILATTDPHKVPITVLSRCLQFVLKNMTAQQVSEHLTHILKTEQIVYEPNALTLLGRAAQGSMRDALSLLDQAIAMGSGSVKESDVREMIGAVDKRYLFELLTFLMEQNGEAMIAKAHEMANNAVGFDSALNDLAMLLQRLALIKTVPSALSSDEPEYENIKQLAQYFSDEQIQLYYQCVIHGKQDLPLAPDEYAGFVMTLLRMLAFAPFAAKNTPVNSVIEGTQLHNPNEVSMPKKEMLPEAESPVFRQPENIAPPIVEVLPQSQNVVAKKTEVVVSPKNKNHIHNPADESMPPLTAENWALIVQKMGTKVGAAQMLLQHTAWVAYENDVLHLAIVEEKVKNSVTKEYIDRISAALTQAYHRPIHIQTQTFETGHDWETPVMHRMRKRLEEREQIQQVVSQSPFVQALSQHYNMTWQDEWFDHLPVQLEDKQNALKQWQNRIFEKSSQLNLKRNY